MSGKISTNVSTTRKPNGGYVSGFNTLDEKSAGISMGRGDFSEASSLLIQGRHPDELFTPQGSSALMCCIVQNDLTFAQRLLLAGANPDKPQGKNHDKTYLGLILSGCDSNLSQPMLELFLNHNANPNLICNSDGDLPLGFTIKNALVGPSKILLDHGADPFITNGQQLNAIHHALHLPDYQKSLMLWTLLESCKGNVNVKQQINKILDAQQDSTLNWILDTLIIDQVS